MALTINGVVHENGAPLLVGGAQADQMTVNGVQVWVNNYAADAPTSFAASDTSQGSVTVTWTAPIDVGVPACTYDLYEESILVASDIASGYVRTVSPGIRTYYVAAVNIAGSTSSNTDTGTSKEASGAQTFTSSGTFTVPLGYTSVTICMCGGGGGGGYGFSGVGGGRAGTVVSQAVAVTSGAAIAVTIGGGGAVAANGGTTSFGAVSAAGGGAGAYFGNGGSRTTCGGTGSDGLGHNIGISYPYYGGASSGFGNGGRSGQNIPAYAEPGGVGSGGGEGNVNTTSNGRGGRGECRITWS